MSYHTKLVTFWPWLDAVCVTLYERVLWAMLLNKKGSQICDPFFVGGAAYADSNFFTREEALLLQIYQNFHHDFLPEDVLVTAPVAWPVTLSFRLPFSNQLNRHHKRQSQISRLFRHPDLLE